MQVHYMKTKKLPKLHIFVELGRSICSLPFELHIDSLSWLKSQQVEILNNKEWQWKCAKHYLIQHAMYFKRLKKFFIAKIANFFMKMTTKVQN